MRTTCLLLALLVSFVTQSQDRGRSGMRPEESRGELLYRLKSLRDSRLNPGYNPPPSRTETGLIIKKSFKENTTDFGTRSAPDTRRQKKPSTPEEDANMRIGSLITENNEGLAFTSVSPADPTIAVGPSHIVQMVNGTQGAYISVSDKSGNVLVQKKYMHDMINSPDYYGYGDPVVLYDQFSGRFFISEFGSDSCATCYANVMVVGVSSSVDPTSGWNFYKFKPGYFFLDFPKYAAWPNLLFASTNDYSPNGAQYLGSSVYAIDKSAMVLGFPAAAMQRVRLPAAEYPKFISMSPVSVSGNVSPKNPDEGLFIYFNDDNRTVDQQDQDSLCVIRFRPDLVNNSNSIVQFDPPFQVAPFKSRVCNGSRDCVASATGAGYDELSDRIMNKVYLRNFGDHETMVLNHTIDVNYPSASPLAGIRWYELQRSSGNWSVAQYGTYAPDGDGRFMGSININSVGQIGLAFNHSGSGKFASIYFTGRNAADEQGLMTYYESPVVIGDDYGTFANRWGDYNELVLDPSDDSTFWLTSMYGSQSWKTKISAFKLQALAKNDVRVVSIESPEPTYASCEPTIRPSILIRNSGSLSQDSITIDTYIDNQLKSSYLVKDRLLTNSNRRIDLPSLLSPEGKHTIRVQVRNLLNMPDEDPTNDAAEREYTIISPVDSSFREGFELPAFPPFQWRVVNYNRNTISWQQLGNIGSGSPGSVVNRLYDNQIVGDSDMIVSTPIFVPSTDSLILSFDRAYKVYGRSGSFADTMEIVLTTDCGQSYQTIWKKGGAGLASVFGSVTTGFVPNQSDWVQEQVDLKPFTNGAQSVSVGFSTINLFGQNIYLDNISVTGINRKRTDLSIDRLFAPAETVCNESIQPEVMLTNRGLDTIKSFSISLELNGQSSEKRSWAGALPPGDSLLFGWEQPINVQAGDYDLELAIVSVNDVADQRRDNDTIHRLITVFGSSVVKMQEGFEKDRFPPSNWHLSASSRGYSWERSIVAGKGSTRSAVVRNPRFNSNGLKEDLYSPIFNMGSGDSVILNFDHAYGRISQLTRADTLEVFLTMDCGASLTSVYRKWGNDLNSIPSTDRDPTFPAGDTVGFLPLPSQWKNNRVDLTKLVPSGRDFQLIFRNSSNEGSNLYIDNINVYGVNLSRFLKENGYQVYPNPFNDQVSVRHYQRALLLREVIVTNALGQRIYHRSFNGNAPDYFNINLGQQSNGLYQVQLKYTDKTITERIIKIQ